MADLSQTAANVVADPGFTSQSGTFGGAIDAGMPVYVDTADNKLKSADNNASALTATVLGLALNGGANGQPGVVITKGDINIGATLVVGETYVLSATAGKICPIGDLAAGNYVTVLGVAISTSKLRLAPIVSGAQVPVS